MEGYGGSTGSWDYLDFELEIREGGPRNYPVAARSPDGSRAQEEMRFPFDKLELKYKLKDLENILYRYGGPRRRIPSQEERIVQEFGQGLLQALFVGDVRACYKESLNQARRQNKGLRLKLRIQPPELAALPWEFLYDPDRDEYLCLSSRRPLVRYLDLPEPVEQFPVTPPLSILGMVTSPLGLSPLDVGHEKRLVEEAIKDLPDELVKLTWLEGQTWDDLQQAMWSGPWHVFHFIGHGGFGEAIEEGALALSDEEGRMRLLRARNLARLLDGHYPLRLVFLNSCEGARGSESDAFSSTSATLVRRGVPAVLAMQYEITDDAAIVFARNFYRAVAHSLPVDAAVAAARTAISMDMDDTLEWGTPVLYMRSPDGRIFDVSTDTPPPEPPPEDPLRRYRESIKSAWTNGELHKRDAEQLSELANELRLSANTAADIEREIMGDTIEAILERQELAAREEQQKKRLDGLYTRAKEITMRPRPFLTLPDARLLVPEPSSFAFPSGHTTSAFAAASGAVLAARRLLKRVPPWGWGMLALAAVISYSRIYVGVHWPTDVAAGVVLGLASGWVGFRLALRRWRPTGKTEQTEMIPEETREVEYVS